MNFLFSFLNENTVKISPYLFLYKSQYTSIFSIFMRISGFLLFIYYYFIIIKFNNNIFFIYNIYNNLFEIFTSLNAYFSFFIFMFIIIFVIYHSIFGIRYIFSINYWNNVIFNKLLELKTFYNFGFLCLCLTIILLFLNIF